MNLCHSKLESPKDTLKGKFSYLNTFIGKEKKLKIEDPSVCHVECGKMKANDIYKAETKSTKCDIRKSWKRNPEQRSPQRHRLSAARPMPSPFPSSTQHAARLLHPKPVLAAYLERQTRAFKEHVSHKSESGEWLLQCREMGCSKLELKPRSKRKTGGPIQRQGRESRLGDTYLQSPNVRGRGKWTYFPSLLEEARNMGDW